MKPAIVIVSLWAAFIFLAVLWLSTPVRRKTLPKICELEMGCYVMPNGACLPEGSHCMAYETPCKVISQTGSGAGAVTVWQCGAVDEHFITGNRVDADGRLNAHGDYSLDAQGRPVRITAAQERFMEPKQ